MTIKVPAMPIVGSAAKFICRTIFLATLALAGAVLSGCDSQGSDPVGDNPLQVTVVGSGEVQGTPDMLTADVGIEFAAPDVTTAMNQTNERQQAVIDALLDAGVDRKDIATTQVSLQPQTENAAAAGYRATNSIQVRIRRLE